MFMPLVTSDITIGETPVTKRRSSPAAAMSLDPFLDGVTLVTGATFLGDGRPVMVLEPLLLP